MTEPTTKVLPSMNKDGSRHWLRPRLSEGRFYYRRLALGYSLMLLFVVLPHLRVSGKPLVLLDVMKRQFVLFGKTFLATDAVLLLIVMLLLFFAIFWFTALFGRVWCGWACPQTVYMELLFRPLERLIEGPPGAQRSLDRKGGTSSRRMLKNVVFLVIAAVLGNSFLAYFVGTDQLLRWMQGSPFSHPTAFGIMAVTTFAVWFDFAWFREQTCLVACPYGRLQSVLLDSDSLIVAYDPNRGEGRGTKRARQSAETPADAAEWGDCIDCSACVATCPTGIDIRDGLQMECINCTQCIDACDAIMTKINKPLGLIRYTSQSNLANEPRRLLRARTILYPLAMTLLAGVLFVLLGVRGEAYITILRDGSTPYQVLQNNQVSNTVIIKVENHKEKTQRYQVALRAPKGVSMIAAQLPLVVPASETRTVRVVVLGPPSVFRAGVLNVRFVFSIGKRHVATHKHQLLGPQHAPGAQR